MRCDELERAAEFLNIDMKHGDYSALEQPILDLLKDNGITDIDKDSFEYKSLCHDVYKAAISIAPLELKAFNGDVVWNDDLPALFPTVYSGFEQVAPMRVGDVKESEPLRNVVAEYLKEKGAASKVRTNPERERAVKHFIQYLNKPDIQYLT